MNAAIEKFYKNRSEAEDTLKNVYKELHQSHASGGHRNFLLFRVQAAIIQFELCSGLFNLMMTPKNCFASKIIFKGLLHIIFEYTKTLKNYHIKMLMDLCDSKSFNSEKDNLTRITRKYRTAIKQIDKFMKLRNMATGHYAPDIAKQISLIESINEDESLKVIKQFVLFNKDVLESMSKIGRKKYISD